jgi:CheY-like chemotaxis protein/signal transduction histidine kinase
MSDSVEPTSLAREFPCDLIPTGLLFESASEAMWVLRRDAHDGFVTVAVNPAWEKLTGVVAAAAVDRPVGQGDSWPGTPIMLERYREIIQSCRPARFAQAVDINGLRSLEIALKPILDRSRTCRYILGCALDCTGRATAEQAARLSEAFTRTVIDSLDEQILILDPDGKIISENDGWRRYVEQCGAPAAAAGADGLNFIDTCMSAEQLVDSECVVKLHAGIRAVLRAELAHFAMEYAVDLNGDRRWASLRAAALTEPHHGAIVSRRDITERKLATERIALLEGHVRQSQKMRALGVLAAGIAAEFNNMLVAIQGHIDLARRDGRRNLKVLKTLAVCSRACRSASTFTSQILAFSRAQPAGRRMLVLPTVVENAAALLRATVQPGHDVEYRSPSSVPPVIAEETQIQQIVLSLGIRAGQAMAGHAGIIRIEVDAVRATRAMEGQGQALKPGLYARISITDTGGGNETHAGARLAEFSGSSSSKRRELEAALREIEEIASANGGLLTVQVHEKTGEKVSVCLPAAPARAREAADDASKSRKKTERRVQPPGTGQRILFVDDQKWLIALVERLLTERGYQALGFDSPQIALDALHAEPDAFDLIVTDYKMPGHTGLDIIRAIKAIRPDMPILLVSGYLSDKLREQAERAGADAVLAKQCLATELLPTLNDLFSRGT